MYVLYARGTSAHGTSARGDSARGTHGPVIAELVLRGTCICKEFLFPLALFIAIALAIGVE